MSLGLCLKKLEALLDDVSKSLSEVKELDLPCKSLLQYYISNITTINKTSVLKIQAVLDRMYEHVNIGNWKEVRQFIRKTITIASYIKLLAYLKRSKDISDRVIREAFKIIDFGILFGCPLLAEPELLQKCATELNSFCPPKIYKIKKCNIKTDVVNNTSTYSGSKIEVLDCPSLESFFKQCIEANKPAILDNCINHWPALTKWKNQNYFIKLAGLRTVSIELGSQYTDSDWTQRLMTMEEFIKHHIYQTDGPTGYLAQYQLFEQIPELKKDIAEPDYCSFTDTNAPVDVNAWYGPKGTVSPMHHDPKRNLLAQVVGEKQIFLFSPMDSEHLYPHEHKLLNNTAKIDPRKPDYDKYPQYKNANPYLCTLRSGQMLYIPPKWWHFVESLSVSFSVSFWWE